MYKAERLKEKTLNKFKELYALLPNHKYNFFSYYEGESIYRRFLMKRWVYLLTNDKEYVGYIWVNEMNGVYAVLELFIKEEHDNQEAYFALLKNLKYYDKIKIKISEKGYKLDIIEQLGFEVTSLVYEMELIIPEEINLSPLSHERLKISNLIKGKDEQIRCDLQNKIFNKKNRVPLVVKDIFYDEMQSYYYDDGVFIVYEETKPIGIGQIIYENFGAVLVNFGIIQEYRWKGYGEYFLKYVIKFMSEKGEKKINLRVHHDNQAAISLYKKKWI
ncbi:GNAT family N-acetyltransferase [Clostridium grantii]|uniref:Acetyltransferase (GNAT) family protein n=1 Tax=Clostridium grantii DSM 8605 TaxID=1121316 RepID=A0A1M5VPJ7_9CLOT|nr:GNAT family N-acetyltransferase [Clostridium grantii]SHH77155.1 Acetyltransferase (GNAT) family protein [Clostridium grantii DSM 8605]